MFNFTVNPVNFTNLCVLSLLHYTEIMQLHKKLKIDWTAKP